MKMNRRSFVQGAAMLGAALAVVPCAGLAFADEKKEEAAPAAEGALQIFAANSLEKALPEVQKLYTEQTGVEFADTQFKASGDLVEQLKGGAVVDLLITASKGTMDKAEEGKLIDMDAVTEEALRRAEQDGIIFIDEIDKVAGRSANGPDVSREGVQRDILPIVEGSTVNTKYGVVKTDYMLFIAAGAFHVAKVTDLIPELQGRFPVRVNLKPLTREDFKAILSQTDNALTRQYEALLAVDHVHLHFEESALDALAQAAQQENETREDIGARRLHTLFEKMLEDISFNAGGDMPDVDVTINGDYVAEHLGGNGKKLDMRQ